MTFDGEAGPRSFNLLFVQNGTGVVLGSIPITINVPYTYQVTASEAGNPGPFSFQVTEAKKVSDGSTIDPSTYQIVTTNGNSTFVWNPTGAGDYQFSIVASDQDSPANTSSPQQFDVHVAAEGANDAAPVLDPVTAQKAYVGTAYSYIAHATDSDGPMVAYYLYNAPAGMIINSQTGAISWTPTAAAIGEHFVTLQAIDGIGGEVSKTIDLTVVQQPGVNRPPMVVSTPPSPALVGEIWGYNVIAVDPDQDVVSFTHAHDSQGIAIPLPSGMTLDDTTGSIVWTPTASQTGSVTVQMEVHDSQGAMVPYSFTVAVGTRPSTPAVPTVTGVSDTTVTLNLAANSNSALYNVYRSISAAGPFILVDPTPVAGPSFTDSGLDPSTTYYYRSTAVTSIGGRSIESQPSATCPATTTAAAVLPVVTISATTPDAYENGQLPGTFTISRPGNIGSLTVSLIVDSSSTASAADFVEPIPTTVTIPDGSYSIPVSLTPVDEGQPSGQKTLVLDVGSSGGYTVGSPNEATLTIHDDDAPPSPVTGLQAFTASTTQINLHWHASSVSNASYKIYRSSDPGFVVDADTFIGSAPAGTSPAYADTWVPTPGTYYYKVTALIGAVESAPSTVSSADSSTLPTAPDPIANLQAHFDPNANQGQGAVILTWDTSALNETDFVFTRTDEDGSVTTITAPANATQLVDAGPFPEVATQPSTGPVYQGNAENAGGKSSDSPQAGAPPLPGSGTGNDDNPLWRDGNFDNNGDGKDDNEGGLDDGDGNQPLTDRDDYWTTHHGSTLFIGFAGHLQSMGFSTNHGRIWDVSPACGTYAIGTRLLTKEHQNVTLFPEDPGNATGTFRNLDGDGVIGVPNPNRGGARVDAQGNADGALAFLIDAIEHHGIRNVGLFGYSYGGGAINILMQTLGIKAANDNALSQLLFPPLVTQPHVDFFAGAFIDAVKINLTNADPNSFDTEGSIEMSNTGVPTVDASNAAGKFTVDRLFNIYQSKRDAALDNPIHPEPPEPRGAEISPADWADAGGAVGKLNNIDTDGNGTDVQPTATHAALDWGKRGLDHTQALGFGIAENDAAGDPKYGGVQSLVIDDLLTGLNDANGH